MSVLLHTFGQCTRFIPVQCYCSTINNSYLGRYVTPFMESNLLNWHPHESNDPPPPEKTRRRQRGRHDFNLSSLSLSLSARKNENETKTTLAGRAGARFFLRAGDFGELKLQGCARGTPASFFTAAAHDLTGPRDVTLKDRKPQAVIELVPGARASGVFPSR